jgi:uncharacterized SAM-binding protein YcdF (DUF218 family)
MIRRKRAQGWRWWRAFTSAGLVIVAVAAWGVGLWQFARQLPQTVSDPAATTDVVVVLTGGSYRVAEGLALLDAGAAPRLFISGVPRGVRVADLVLHGRLAEPLAACCVTLGHAAEDTIGNAAEIAGFMTAGGYRSLRLVTADYHMPRAMLEVARGSPGVTIVAHPVFPPGFRRGDWWRWPGTTALVVVEYTKTLAARARHAVVDLMAGGRDL